MRMSFEETMRGTLRSARGDSPVEFTVIARAEGRGYFTLDGTVSAKGFAAEGTRTNGSLYIALLGGIIRYRLHFDGFTLEAEKSPSVFSPVRSMTFMPVKLLDKAGSTVAQGEMTFDLKDLPSFVLSAFTVKPRALLAP
jgi:hypothetical protein